MNPEVSLIQDEVREHAGAGRSQSAQPPEPAVSDSMKPSPVEVTLDAGGGIAIRGEATVHHVSRLWEQLNALERDAAARVSIDLSGLTSLDTAGAQTLIAFRRSCNSSSLHSCPLPIRQFLELTGLTCLLTSEHAQWRT